MTAYPRTERCVVCGEHDVDVISPADWAVCTPCHLELQDEYVPTLAEVLRFEEEAMQARRAEDEGAG